VKWVTFYLQKEKSWVGDWGNAHTAGEPVLGSLVVLGAGEEKRRRRWKERIRRKRSTGPKAFEAFLRGQSL
jgi:hypothetical protein